MRGKRFKAAVQQAFAQRGWTKGEEVTWKDVAHLVGLKEEDSESEWERVLAVGGRGARRHHRPRGDAPLPPPLPPLGPVAATHEERSFRGSVGLAAPVQ